MVTLQLIGYVCTHNHSTLILCHYNTVYIHNTRDYCTLLSLQRLPITNTLVKKKNSTVIGIFKYYLAQRFSNSGISRTPKLPQIRPGSDPYLIRLFSRLPHLMRFLSLDVLLQKMYETHYQI